MRRVRLPCVVPAGIVAAPGSTGRGWRRTRRSGCTLHLKSDRSSRLHQRPSRGQEDSDIFHLGIMSLVKFVLPPPTLFLYSKERVSSDGDAPR